ncbi:MAG: hypothetical protein CVV53_02930 [Spirochaetae bacterium HGW-Spirochaetae-9]|nr:MAG: hypothetical protein CVV53_02930 [Spirochaetae bacterium HGW-Spirochaetae-9]
MLFIDRPDGKKVKQAHALNAVMPYMMSGRNQSAVYYDKDIDVEAALLHVRAKNACLGPKHEIPEQERCSLFALVLAALVRTIAIRPGLNRFIHGRALYQRNEIAISFVVKQKMTEAAPEGSAKVYFKPEDNLDAVTHRVNKAIAYVREVGEGGDGEEIAKLAHRIPGAKALVIGLYKLLDRFNLAPAALLRVDPFYATLFFANLGSIGLDTPFHHLYEWGNASFFVVMGKMTQKEGHRIPSEAKHHCINFKVTLDERISDGLYFARSASIFYRLLTSPALLDLGLEEAKSILEKGNEGSPDRMG